MKSKKEAKQQTKGPGAPPKAEHEKKLPNGLTKEQSKRIRDEATARDVPAAYILREAVDWYFTAKDTKRGDVEASKLFDAK